MSKKRMDPALLAAVVDYVRWQLGDETIEEIKREVLKMGEKPSDEEPPPPAL